MKKNSGTKKLVVSLFIISTIAVFVAYIYYSSQNALNDPRIVPAKEKLLQYDRMMSELKYEEVFPLLDTVEKMIASISGYENSFELGVVYNNRGSSYLTLSINENDSLSKFKLLDLAEKNIQKSITIYQNWIDSTKDYKEEDFLKLISPIMSKDKALQNVKNLDDIIDNYVSERMLAKIETPRRLSVAYTNLGIITRHKFLQEESLECYRKALELWPDNHTARNNLNMLLDKPLEERSIIDQLFPKDRTKPDNQQEEAFE
ncbi:MAG: hypothetical protein C0594_16615 [Marinilabiliales bacterium]|nr:MAG: hypothetical protein C0594_16615 [Marinilabiliales bacterium]